MAGSASRRAKAARPGGSRAAPRPPRQRRTTGAVVGRTARPAARKGPVTTRAAVLAVIVCALVLALTYPIRAYLSQRANIGALGRQRAAAQQRVDDLEKQRKRWDDPAYVEAQARERLRYVRPGEMSYVVADPPARPAAIPTVGPRVLAPDAPWYDRLWSSVEVAGVAKPVTKVEPETAPAPARKPAAKTTTRPGTTVPFSPFQPR